MRQPAEAGDQLCARAGHPAALAAGQHSSRSEMWVFPARKDVQATWRARDGGERDWRDPMDHAAVDRRVAGLVAGDGSPEARPGALLCDRPQGEDGAFTILESDPSVRDLTFAELGDLSAAL